MPNRLDRVERRRRRRERWQRLFRPRLKDRENPFENYDEGQFKARFHMAKGTCLFVLQLIKDDLNAPVRRGAAIPAVHQLLIALRFYSGGSFQREIGDVQAVVQSSVSKIVRKVSQAIAHLSSRFIKYPSHEEASECRRKFFEIGGFPGVVGAIDCTLIKINSPGGMDAELYRSRKSYFAINVQAICDADLCFTNVVARWYGSAHDSRIFDNSVIKEEILRGRSPGILLGDAGYALQEFLMTPLRNPTTAPQRRYNKSQIKTRNVIERTFGILKRRSPCLNHLRLKPSTSLAVIIAVSVLHNICRRRNDLFEEDENTMPSDPQPTSSSESSLRGRAKQQEIISSHFT